MGTLLYEWSRPACSVVDRTWLVYDNEVNMLPVNLPSKVMKTSK